MFTAVTRDEGALGRPVSAAALHRIHATLRAALNGAVRAGLISVSPGRYPELPRAARPRPQVWTPTLTGRWQQDGWRPVVGVRTAAQTSRFLAQVRGHRLYALFHLVALRGPRRGEAAGLRWSDLDLDAGTLTVLGSCSSSAAGGSPGRPRATPDAGSSPSTPPPSPRCASTGSGSRPNRPPPGPGGASPATSLRTCCPTAAGGLPLSRRPAGEAVPPASPWPATQSQKPSGCQPSSSDREARQRLVGRAARALQVREALLDPLVQLEAQAEERDDPVGLMVAAPELRIDPPGGLARALQRGPAPGRRQQSAEQVLAAVLGGQVGPPPAKPALFARLARPRHHKLRGESHVDVRHRNRLPMAAGWCAFHIEHTHGPTLFAPTST